MRRILLLALAVVVCSSSAAMAQGWGTIKGRFVFDGAAPKPAPLDITKDQAVCGKHNLVDETLLVNSQNKGIANVIVSLYLTRGATPPKAHPDYAKAAKEPVTLDNANCRFEPHVLAVQTGQPVILGNKDPVAHNTKIDFFANSPINPLIPANASVKQTFTNRETIPSPVGCSIHPWMTGYLFVQDHPYVAVSDKDGNFEIKNLPVGEWKFRAWQEKSGYVSDVKVGGKSEKWSRGQFDRKVENGKALDLGDILVNADVFKK